VAAADYAAVKNEHRADGNPALGRPFFGFRNGGCQKRIHILFYHNSAGSEPSSSLEERIARSPAISGAVIFPKTS
jgi:hypothetical protein